MLIAKPNPWYNASRFPCLTQVAGVSYIIGSNPGVQVGQTVILLASGAGHSIAQGQCTGGLCPSPRAAGLEGTQR